MLTFGLTSCDITTYETAGYAPSRSYSPAPAPVYGYAPPSPYYQTGYYPYQAVPNNQTSQDRNRHVYKIGKQIGRDDYYAGRKKSYGKHSALYDRYTEEAFKQGFYAGYENARERDKRRN